MAAIPSLGFGTGLAVAATGVNVVLPYPAGALRIKNTGSAVLYVVLNVILVGSDGVTPIAGVYPSGAVPTTDLQVKRMQVADALAIATGISTGDTAEFRGLAAFNGGPQIVCAALISAAGGTTALGGQIDVSN